MKLDCDVIRDLLPLYAEHIASPASTALVEEHLEECEACRAELKQMQMPVPVQPEPQPDAPLKKIKKTLQKKRIHAAAAAAAAVLASLCAAAMVFWMGTARVPATAEQAKLWAYSRKENDANLCVLEAQGEGVWLDMEGTFSWGDPQITVQAMRYRFPQVHRTLKALVGSDVYSEQVTVSRTQVLTVVCADETLYYRDGQRVERFIIRENVDGTTEYGYGDEQIYGNSFRKG